MKINLLLRISSLGSHMTDDDGDDDDDDDDDGDLVTISNLASNDLATWIGEDELLGGRHLLKDVDDENDDGDDADADDDHDDHHHLSS